MDFTKFVGLLENRSLFFARSDQFDDPYEGAWSRAGVAMLRDPATSGGLPPDAVDQILMATANFRQQMFISCWVASEHESAAMWKLYLQTSEGVAVCTDHDTLVAALDRSPLRARTTMVRYVDYDKTPIPFGNLFFPFVHKRLSFAHENELRAVVWSAEDINKTQITPEATGVTIDVLPEELIKSVHVAPTARKWFGQLVERILRRYGYSIPVVRSTLYDRPSY